MVRVLRDFRRRRVSPATRQRRAAVKRAFSDAMFPERLLAGKYRQTRRSRVNSRRTTTAEVYWPRKHRPWTAWSHGGRSRSRGAEAEEEEKHNDGREGKEKRKAQEEDAKHRRKSKGAQTYNVKKDTK
eukprot:5628735-Heterocapsa_arctica.AAC.1